MNKVEAINEKAKGYQQVLAQPWNVLGYSLRQHNLAKHLAEAVSILDIGGGSAQEAVDLARLGHMVVVLEPSTEMAKQARTNIEAAGLASCIQLYDTELDKAQEYLEAEAFDVILCHNVLQYLPDREKALGQMAQYLKPGGLLSLVSLNKYSEPFRLATQQQSIARAREALAATSYTTEALGVEVALLTVEDVTELAKTAGLSNIAQYGIRCINDYVLDNPSKTPESILDLELELCDRYPYYLLARFFHLLFEKVSVS
ncbi:MAG: methyltransferase domain-containing protein [Trueperaceae bacterium]|nr:methyltransferase domain-containing protein [Trueperaceae bacterium]